MTRNFRPADHRGFFAYHHDNPPLPFNPEADPRSAERYRTVTESMESDDFYASHTREECRLEWKRRYEEQVERDNAQGPRP
jgi:hypothetical protein